MNRKRKRAWRSFLAAIVLVIGLTMPAGSPQAQSLRRLYPGSTDEPCHGSWRSYQRSSGIQCHGESDVPNTVGSAQRNFSSPIQLSATPGDQIPVYSHFDSLVKRQDHNQEQENEYTT